MPWPVTPDPGKHARRKAAPCERPPTAAPGPFPTPPCCRDPAVSKGSSFARMLCTKRHLKLRWEACDTRQSQAQRATSRRCRASLDNQGRLCTSAALGGTLETSPAAASSGRAAPSGSSANAASSPSRSHPPSQPSHSRSVGWVTSARSSQGRGSGWQRQGLQSSAPQRDQRPPRARRARQNAPRASSLVFYRSNRSLCSVKQSSFWTRSAQLLLSEGNTPDHREALVQQCQAVRGTGARPRGSASRPALSPAPGKQRCTQELPPPAPSTRGALSRVPRLLSVSLRTEAGVPKGEDPQAPQKGVLLHSVPARHPKRLLIIQPRSVRSCWRENDSGISLQIKIRACSATSWRRGCRSGGRAEATALFLVR